MATAVDELLDMLFDMIDEAKTPRSARINA